MTLRDADGSPRFPGIRAVGRSLAARCADTRATVHLAAADPAECAPWDLDRRGCLLAPDVGRLEAAG